MNLFFILSIIAVIFIIADLVTAAVLKLKRTVLRNISLVSLVGLTVAFLTIGIVSSVNNSYNELMYLHNGYHYLMDDDADNAEANAKKVNGPHSDMIMLLAQCIRKNYSSAFIISDDLISNGKLTESLSQQASKVNSLARSMTELEDNKISEQEFYNDSKQIIADCFELLEINEDKSTELLTSYNHDKMLSSKDYYNVDFTELDEMLNDNPDLQTLKFSVHSYSAVGEYSLAEKYAEQLVEKENSAENMVLLTEVLSQSSYSGYNYDEDGEIIADPEVDALLQKALDAEEMAEYYDYDDPLYQTTMDKAEEYRNQASSVRIVRIINWLRSRIPIWGDSSGLLDLQLSRLYCAANEEDKAKELLDSLLDRANSFDGNSPIYLAIKKFKRVYENSSSTDEEINDAVNELLNSDVFLPDTQIGRDYSEFLNRVLKYERVSIFISKVDSTAYPDVKVYLNVNGKRNGEEELANDFVTEDFSFVDEGYSISPSDITKVESDNKQISIALVIDGSGSMEGEGIENARKAVEACIDNMDPENQELSIVIYEDTGRTITELTNDPNKLRNGAEQIMANGGTVISSGIFEGIASLKNAIGTKAIILMTDGEDGSPETINDAIFAAQQENISIFTVSTGGGERAYMENIAQQTGGAYMEAITDSELVDIYTTLQNYIVNNYCFEYKVKENVNNNPRLLTVGLNDYNIESSRTYCWGDLTLTKDGCYVTRMDEGNIGLYYSEPSIVSPQDTVMGIPIFLSGYGFTDGTKIYINGKEMADAKVVNDSTIAFVLQGEYEEGPLNIKAETADKKSKSSNTLLSVSGYDTTTQSSHSGTHKLLLGNSSYIYADIIDYQSDGNIMLQGNVVLNDFVHTDGVVYITPDFSVTSENAVSIMSGFIDSSSPAYIVLPEGEDNYGKMAYNGDKIQVLDYFSFIFSEDSISNSLYGDCTLDLPGFGQVYVSGEFDGTKFTYMSEGSMDLSYLSQNLGYALNNIENTENEEYDSSLNTILGIYDDYYYPDNLYTNSGIYAQADYLTVEIGSNYVDVKGSGTVTGNIGILTISEAAMDIDTDNIDSMFSISGDLLDSYDAEISLGTANETGSFTIGSKGYYPDSIAIQLGAIDISGTSLSDCFYNDTPPKELDTDINYSYLINLDNEPYYDKIAPFLNDINIHCDKIKFVYEPDSGNYKAILYNSSQKDKYVEITQNGVIVPINDVDEINLFGTDIGGEIQGTATINEYSIYFNISIDGHLDNSFYQIKFDGKSTMEFNLSRNSYLDEYVKLYVNYADKTLEYDASVLGGIIPQNGFNNYSED